MQVWQSTPPWPIATQCKLSSGLVPLHAKVELQYLRWSDVKTLFKSYSAWHTIYHLLVLQFTVASVHQHLAAHSIPVESLWCLLWLSASSRRYFNILPWMHLMATCCSFQFVTSHQPCNLQHFLVQIQTMTALHARLALPAFKMYTTSSHRAHSKGHHTTPLWQSGWLSFDAAQKGCSFRASIKSVH